MSNRFLEALNAQAAAFAQQDNGDEVFTALFDHVVQDIEKTAQARNWDLSAVSDDDLADVIADEMAKLAGQLPQQDGHQKHAGAALVTDEQVSAADYLGRVQAAAMADELLLMQKHAEVSAWGPDTIEELAVANANDILVQLDLLDGRNADHIPVIAEVNGREKVASVLATYPITEEIDEAIAERTMFHLQNGGWPVEKIAQVLIDLAYQDRG